MSGNCSVPAGPVYVALTIGVMMQLLPAGRAFWAFKKGAHTNAEPSSLFSPLFWLWALELLGAGP